MNAEEVMARRFGMDSVIALATESGGVPHVRCVNGFYQDGAFYVITYALSGKMRQIAKNPQVALAGEWFTGHGRAESLGWFGSAENSALAARLRDAFSAWIDNGHNDFSDTKTCILRVRLTDGVVWYEGTRYTLPCAPEA